MDIFEVILSLLSGVFQFFTEIYQFFMGNVVESFFNFFDSSYDDFTTYGIGIIDNVFARFDFTSDKFTNNFIYFFIGILFFAMFIKIMFKLLSFLANFAGDAIKAFLPFI